MFDLAGVLSVALAFFVVTVSPGPANIAVATIAMSYGRRSGLTFGAGLSVGLAFWGVIAATGLGALLQGSTHLLLTLKIFGGIYLLYLACQSGFSAFKPSAEALDPPRQGMLFRQGLLLNLSNPKAVVAWVAALSMGLGAGDGNAPVIAATLVCITLGFLNYAGYAVAFSLSGVMATYKRMRKWIDGAVAGIFALTGFGLIKSALSR